MKIYGGKCKRFMGRETGGDEYVLKEIQASKSEWHRREEKQTFTLDFYTRDGLSDR